MIGARGPARAAQGPRRPRRPPDRHRGGEVRPMVGRDVRARRDDAEIGGEAAEKRSPSGRGGSVAHRTALLHPARQRHVGRCLHAIRENRRGNLTHPEALHEIANAERRIG